jgi:fructose-1,6-bisphosphatase/inositol monophosphatase family enzyme
MCQRRGREKAGRDSAHERDRTRCFGSRALATAYVFSAAGDVLAIDAVVVVVPALDTSFANRQRCP